MEPLRLSSITDCEPLIFNWPLNTNEKRNNHGTEIVELINYAYDEYPILKNYFDINLIKINPIDKKNYEIISKICNEFNKSIVNLKSKESNLNILLNKKASNKLIKFIMQFIYNKAVYDPDKLNHYEPFSPQVYGETSFELIQEMLKRVNLTENDIFIDLGSGVGNVVLQVASLTNCKLAFGIEKAEWPCKYAKSMENHFKLIISWFGKLCSKFQLYNGDFLDDTDPNVNLKEMINEAKLIFVNNYAFGAEVDHQLKLRFSNMTEGAIIVSSKPFCSLNFRINSRNLNDIGAILNISEFTPISGHVSWTDKPINYYFHKIDRTLLEKYFERLKNPKIKDENSQGGDSNNGKKTFKRNSSTTDDDNDDDNDNDDDENLNHKVRRKNKKLKRELSNGSVNNKNHNTSNSSNNGTKKRDKIKSTTISAMSKNDKKTNSKSSPTIGNNNKLLDKNLINTLNIMHNQAIKASLIVSSNFNKDEQNNIENDYNNTAMTKLRSTNIDCKLLKDCTIMDCDEYDIREQLGPDVSNAVDDYLKLYKKQLLNYLFCMKLPQYVEMIKKQINNELKIRNEIVKKTEQIEKQISTLSKSSVTLLKIRVSELGLKDIQTPKDLIEFASTILGNHQELLNKVNNLQQTVDSLQNQNENLSQKANDSISINLNKNINPKVNKNNNKIKEERLIKSPSSPIIMANNNYLTTFEPVTPIKNESNHRSSSDETLTANEEIDDEDHIENKNESNKSNKKGLSFKDYATYFNTNKTNELLKNFKIPKKSDESLKIKKEENEHQMQIQHHHQQQQQQQQQQQNYHFKKKKFLAEFQNNDSNEGFYK